MGKKASEGETKPAKKEEKEVKPKGTKLELPEEPPKPDSEKLKGEIDLIEKEIEKLKEEQKELSAQIDARQEGKEEYDEKRKVLRADFDKAKDNFDQLRQSLYALTDEVKKNKEAGFNSKKELKSLEGSIKNLDEASIDKKIREVEMRMHTTSMSLSQEKAAMKEIAELKKKRPEVKRMAEKLAALRAESEKTGASAVPLEEQIQDIKKQMEVARKDKDEKNALVTALQEERNSKNSGIKDIIDKRKELKEKIDAEKDRKWELKKANDEISKAHWEWQKKVRKIKYEAQKEKEDREWELWEQEKKKKELEKAAEKPYFEEMTLLEQTIDYCKSIMKEEKKEEVKEETKSFGLEGAPEGAMVMLSKKDRETEMYIDGNKGKKGKLKNKQQGGEKKAKNIKHNAGTFALFSKLKISAPMTMDDVPACLEKLEAEMEVYNGKIKEWEAKKDEIAKQIMEADSKIKGEEAPEEAAEE